MRKHNGMRPQDVVVLLKIICLEGKNWRYIDLSRSLHISQSEVAEALGRCKLARLVDSSKRNVFRASLLEFILHGFKYVFPAEPGPIVRGMPTAHSASPLSELIVSEKDVYAWPYAEGEVRGQSIQPLYKNLPRAASEDPQLYELLALLDAIRVGRAREYQVAKEELSKRIKQEVYV